MNSLGYAALPAADARGPANHGALAEPARRATAQARPAASVPPSSWSLLTAHDASSMLAGQGSPAAPLLGATPSRVRLVLTTAAALTVATAAAWSLHLGPAAISSGLGAYLRNALSGLEDAPSPPRDQPAAHVPPPDLASVPVTPQDTGPNDLPATSPPAAARDPSAPPDVWIPEGHGMDELQPPVPSARIAAIAETLNRIGRPGDAEALLRAIASPRARPAPIPPAAAPPAPAPPR